MQPDWLWTTLRVVRVFEYDEVCRPASSGTGSPRLRAEAAAPPTSPGSAAATTDQTTPPLYLPPRPRRHRHLDLTNSTTRITPPDHAALPPPLLPACAQPAGQPERELVAVGPRPV